MTVLVDPLMRIRPLLPPLSFVALAVTLCCGACTNRQTDAQHRRTPTPGSTRSSKPAPKQPTASKRPESLVIPVTAKRIIAGEKRLRLHPVGLAVSVDAPRGAKAVGITTGRHRVRITLGYTERSGLLFDENPKSFRLLIGPPKPKQNDLAHQIAEMWQIARDAGTTAKIIAKKTTPTGWFLHYMIIDKDDHDRPKHTIAVWRADLGLHCESFVCCLGAQAAHVKRICESIRASKPRATKPAASTPARSSAVTPAR